MYAEKTDHWEEWKKEYKWGAFYLFPPQQIMQAVNNLRKKYDPHSAAISPAHISLSDVLLEPLTEDSLMELKIALLTFKPFTIKYGPLRTFPPYPGVTFDIGPTDLFFKLRSLIHKTSLFANNKLDRQGIPPHMTIAEFGLDMEGSETLKKKLENQVSTGTWYCKGISFAVPDNDFCFRETLFIPFQEDKI